MSYCPTHNDWILVANWYHSRGVELTPNQLAGYWKANSDALVHKLVKLGWLLKGKDRGHLRFVFELISE